MCKTLLQTGIFIMLMYVSLPAIAQKNKFYNYMSSDTSEYVLQMQDFHIKQALLKIDNNQLAQAWGDFAYVLYYIPNHHIALKYMRILAPELDKSRELQEYLDIAIAKFPEDQELKKIYNNSDTKNPKNDNN